MVFEPFDVGLFEDEEVAEVGAFWWVVFVVVLFSGLTEELVEESSIAMRMLTKSCISSSTCFSKVSAMTLKRLPRSGGQPWSWLTSKAASVVLEDDAVRCWRTCIC